MAVFHEEKNIPRSDLVETKNKKGSKGNNIVVLFIILGYNLVKYKKFILHNG